MKHTLTILLTLCLTLCLTLSLLAIGASAQSEPVTTVTVTIAVKGELVATQEEVEVTDSDNDGALTVGDALYAVHQKLYEGGADAGYASYQSEYGLSMSKLWGDESGAYGYYLNNASCASLADQVKDGDHVTAFVYKSDDWSDVYTYFDISEKTVALGDEVTLTLMAAGYDENWNPITYPVQGATITMDGNPVYVTMSSTQSPGPAWVTDENGQVTIQISAISGSSSLVRIISATSDSATLVPPVCKLNLMLPETEEQTQAESTGCEAVAGMGILALLPIAYLCIKRKEK